MNIILTDFSPILNCYEGHDFPMDYFTVTVKEPSKYRILVHAEDFIGSYKLSYGRSQ